MAVEDYFDVGAEKEYNMAVVGILKKSIHRSIIGL